MKWAYNVKEKMKVVAVLAVIMAMIFLNNITDRKTFSDLDHSITSIYEDRLMPSTYIFQLADHLYQKRLNYEKAMANGKEPGAGQMEHNKAIAMLIKNYEATYLTKAEQKQWALFKQRLQQYNSLLTGTNIAGETVLNNSFDKTLSCLNTLSNIQADEGEHLRSGSKAMISGTIITSRFEFTLLVILGAFALVLVSAGDKRVFKISGDASLN